MPEPCCTTWRTSSRCGASTGCVQVAAGLAPVVYVRDSTRPRGPVLEMPVTQWRALLANPPERTNHA